MSEPIWRVFHAEDLLEELDTRSAPYLEFLRVPALSCGIYQLKAGATDLQGPHDEDEVYFILEGRARLSVDGQEREVRRGSILYVGASSQHSFVEILEDLKLLVFFASGGPGTGG